MFCPNCGTKNDDAAVFCANCGTSLKDFVEATPVTEETPVAETAPVQETPVVEATPVQQTAPQQAAPAPRAPMDPAQKKKLITISAIVIAVIVVITVFVNIGKNLSDYTKVAEKYFKAQSECDWDKVYGLVDIPKADFLTKDQLKAAKSDTAEIEISALKSKSYEDDSDVTQNVRISYSAKGYSGAQTEYIEMVKLDGEKTLLFFDKYKISPDNLVSKNFKIRVYKGAQVTIDDIAVDAKYLKNDSSKSAELYDTYEIDYIFSGKHSINVTAENMEPYDDVTTIDFDEDTFSYTSPEMSKEAIATVEKASQEAWTKIVEAAVAGKDFSAVQDLFVDDSSIRSTATSRYNSYKSSIRNTSTNYGYKTLKLSSIKAEGHQTSSSDGYLAVSVDLSANTTGDYVSRAYSSLTHQYEDKTETKTGTDSAYIYFRYQDGAWKIYRISL